MSTTLRWLKFNAIGMAGAGLQLWALHLLLRANVAIFFSIRLGGFSAEVLKDPVYRIAAAPAATSRIPKTTPVKNLTGPPCGSPLYAWSGAVRHSRSGPDST